MLRDQDSIAGTWVNYQPVAEKGQILQHGDIIHMGRIAYRFKMIHAPPAPAIKILPADPFALPSITENRTEEM